MFKYRLRPGYGSDKLLIEFNDSPDNADFQNAVRKVFADAKIVARAKENVPWFGWVHEMTGAAGDFTLEVDDWNNVFIFADNNQEAFAFLDGKLKASSMFEKEEVDYAQHRLKVKPT